MRDYYAQGGYRVRFAPDLPAALRDCASGRELAGNGYPGDVVVAGERTDSPAVPVLIDGWFRAG